MTINGPKNELLNMNRISSPTQTQDLQKIPLL